MSEDNSRTEPTKLRGNHDNPLSFREEVSEVATKVGEIHKHLVGTLDSPGLNEMTRRVDKRVTDLEKSRRRNMAGFFSILVGTILAKMKGIL